MKTEKHPLRGETKATIAAKHPLNTCKRLRQHQQLLDKQSEHYPEAQQGATLGKEAEGAEARQQEPPMMP
jgi:hypothetical protein